jgi:hypothetical protein
MERPITKRGHFDLSAAHWRNPLLYLNRQEQRHFVVITLDNHASERVRQPATRPTRQVEVQT